MTLREFIALAQLDETDLDKPLLFADNHGGIYEVDGIDEACDRADFIGVNLKRVD